MGYQSIVMEMDLPSTEQTMRLARKQILRYSNQRGKAIAGEPGYQLDEINDLLWVWDGIIRKSGVWSLLSYEQRRVVLETVDGGE